MATTNRKAGRSGQALSARQVDQSVQTNFEFAKELGAGAAQYPKAGGTAASRVGQSEQRTTVNLRGEE
jgi:hypothetical protein